MKAIDRPAIIKQVHKLMDSKEKVSQPELSKEFGCSRGTFYNILKEEGIDIAAYNKSIIKAVAKENEKKFEIVRREDIETSVKSNGRYSFKVNPDFMSKTKSEEKEEEKSIIDEPDGYIYNYAAKNKKYLIASLVSGRHNLIDSSIERYVYRGPIRSDLMFDFDRLYQIADTFIKEQVLNKGYDKLKIVVTGLTQCVGAIVKASIDNKIGLVLMHYNNVTGRYIDQFICGSGGDFGTSLLDLYAAAKQQSTIMLIGHDQEYYQDKNKLFLVKVDNMDTKETVVYITDELSVMFKYYSEQVQLVMDDKFNTFRIIADELTYGATNMEFQFSNTLGTYYNKPKN